MKYAISLVLLMLAGCATFSNILEDATSALGAAGGGAAGAAIGGPGGAAIGAAVGSLTTDVLVPDVISPIATSPDTIWGLLSKLVDQAVWILILIVLLNVLMWFCPPPKELKTKAVEFKDKALIFLERFKRE